MKKIADFYYQYEERQPGSIKKLIKRWQDNELKALIKEISFLEKVDFSELTSQELSRRYKNFCRIYSAFWREAIFLDAFDVMSDEILEQALERERRQPSTAQLQVLTSPTELSWLQREKKELFELIDCSRRTPGLLAFLKRGRPSFKSLKNKFPGFAVRLKKHAASFHWIYNDYAVIRRLPESYFLRKISEYLKDKKALAKEKQSLLIIRRLTRKQRQIAIKLHLSRNFITALNFLIALAKWRDWRKAFNQMASGTLQLFAGEFVKRTDWTKDEVEYLWWWEAQRIFKLPSSIHQLVRKRKQGMFIFGNAAKERNILYGKTALGLNKFMDGLLKKKGELTGRPAYHGFVRGTVKIIRTQKDFYKMKKGDILIAPNTRPEYVPVMKIAGAIVSEEGGLTCHTAIVARELKIPAIVGAQGIINAVRDGQRVEVDASQGLIKKL